MWTRRSFIAAAGAGFVAGLGAPHAHALERSELVFATTAKRKSGSYAAALVSERGELISSLDLPDRGHDATQCPMTGRIVIFARRPGTFAIVMDRKGHALQTITSVEGRHFFGHGVFSPDGRLLYATENDFGNAAGMIGIYDATNDFARIGEFASGGMDPHDLLLSPDGKLICIANGGIETHPDFGRQKLNLATMRPNLTWIERASGAMVETHELASEWHQLSLRHLGMGNNGRIWVGGQFEGAKDSAVPLLASASPDDELRFASLPDEATKALNFYVGSVAASPDGEHVIATSPKGNVAVIHHIASGKTETRTLKNVCGAAWGHEAFVISSGDGALQSEVADIEDAGIMFDNHLYALKN